AMALFTLLPAASHAQQSTTVSGRVLSDAQTPLQGVSVTIASAGLGATTDAAGRYSFSVPTARARGAASLTARRIGYQSTPVSINLARTPLTRGFSPSATGARATGARVTAPCP